eukprot:366072-Chlamydomonas_euryale.AAC.10
MRAGSSLVAYQILGPAPTLGTPNGRMQPCSPAHTAGRCCQPCRGRSRHRPPTLPQRRAAAASGRRRARRGPPDGRARAQHACQPRACSSCLADGPAESGRASSTRATDHATNSRGKPAGWAVAASRGTKRGGGPAPLACSALGACWRRRRSACCSPACPGGGEAMSRICGERSGMRVCVWCRPSHRRQPHVTRYEHDSRNGCLLGHAARSGMWAGARPSAAALRDKGCRPRVWRAQCSILAEPA